MYAKYLFGFLIDSFVQAGIVMVAETTGISHMGAKLTLTQLQSLLVILNVLKVTKREILKG